MTKTQKIILGVLLVLNFALLYGVGMKVYDGWAQEPLGPVLDYPTPYKFPPTWTPVPQETLATQATRTPFATFALETSTPVPAFFACSALPTMMILGVGSDARSTEYKYGRADVIRVIRIDFQQQRVTVLSFPRDLWVQIPEVEDNLGTNQQKLNTAYFYGNPGLHFWDHPSEGPGLLALTLEQNFGLEVEHYIAVSMNVFVDVIDELGGLDIYLEEEVDGRYSYDRSERLYFPAGEQHLSGEEALTLARTRNVSTFARTGHQNQVICTVQERVKNPDIIPKIPAIIASFQENLQTDLTPLQLSQLACLGVQMPKTNIVFSSFPRNLFHSAAVYDPVAKKDLFIWQSDFDEIRSYVDAFEAGTWPTISLSPFATPESGTSTCE